MIGQLDVEGLTGLLVALAAVLGPGGVVALITALTRRELRKSVGDDDRTVMQALDEMEARQGVRFDRLESRVALLEEGGSAPGAGAGGQAGTPGEISERPPERPPEQESSSPDA